jgi:hypothetical protein
MIDWIPESIQNKQWLPAPNRRTADSYFGLTEMELQGTPPLPQDFAAIPLPATLAPLSPSEPGYATYEQEVRRRIEAMPDCSDESEQVIRLNVALEHRFVGNYVAYIDRWRRNQVKRHVLTVASQLIDFTVHLQDVFASLPPHERPKVAVVYFGDPDGPLQVNY